MRFGKGERQFFFPFSSFILTLMTPEILTVPSVAAAAADLFADLAKESVEREGRFVALLSGGSTPLAMYERLRTRDDLPWEQTVIFWGDERFVPHDDPQSNFGNADEALLEHVPVPLSNIHPWPFVPGDPEGAARTYETLLQATLGKPPRFDLTFLGLGEDGHTASLFPDTEAVRAQGLTVVSRTEERGTRLSLTAGALSRSRVVAFLVSGEGKREALTKTLRAAHDPERLPAQAVGAEERLLWLTDLKL